MDTELKLQIEKVNGHSRVVDSYFTSPLKIGTPKSEGSYLKVVLMMASAGILKGDAFSYEIHCAAGTKSIITEQSYSKIFDTGEGSAKKQIQISLKGDASLFYHPCAVIPFKGSTFDGEMIVHLDKNSEFSCSDIVTAGRVGMGEKFDFLHFRNRVCVMVDNCPVWLDNCLLEPQKMSLEDMIYFDDYTHQGTFYYYGPREKQEQIAGLADNERVTIGVTHASEGICVRVLAHTAQDIEEVFVQLETIVNMGEV